MATISVENGKRIEELLEVSKISADSFFLVSETDLTRKITLVNLRNMFNGDAVTSDLNNVYYSVEKINELLDHIYDEIGKINTKLDSFEKRIDNIYNDLGGDLSEFKKYVENIYAELKLADQNLNTKIDTTKTELTTLINNTKTELTNSINTVKTDLNKRCDDLNTRLVAVENKLKNITQIQIGTAVPTNLASGVVYLQYF